MRRSIKGGDYSPENQGLVNLMERSVPDVPHPYTEVFPYVTAETSRHDGTAWLLFSLGSNLNARYALEVGTAFGYTSLYMAHVHTMERVWTVDIKPCQEAKENFEKFDWGRKIRQITGDSLKIDLPVKPGQLDLLFLDSDYSYEYLKSEWERYTPLVKKGGIVVIHDTQQAPVGRFIKEIGSKFPTVNVSTTAIIKV